MNTPSIKPAAPVERPVLSREADATYWMSRYLERTENVARLLLSSTEGLVDVREVAPALLERQWRSVLHIMNVDAPVGAGTLPERVALLMAFDEENPSSLVTCLTRARENARGIRESISSDMWEHLNRHYWRIRSEEAKSLFQESPQELYRETMSGAMSFQGLADETLPHDQRWHFARLGRCFERITFTCRLLMEAATSPGGGGVAFRNVHWMTVLRSCNSHEAYRRANPGDVEPATVADFLLLDARFPRSVRYNVRVAAASIAAIGAEVRPLAVDPAERVLGRLQAHLDYTDPAELLAGGLPPPLEHIVHQTGLAALAMQQSYFLR